MTVLFVGVVQSADIAAALGAPRFGEVMAALFDCWAMVVRRYGGIVDTCTEAGVVAVFGAPVALADHAVRACCAALDIHTETQCLSAQLEDADGVLLQLRVGLHSGRVIVGGSGCTPLSYTTLGAEAGLAQRVESVAPPGGVMLTETTAGLVHTRAVLGERETVNGAPARRLISMANQRRWIDPDREMSA
ncbi:adenylate/guanylate cyclase domain-containing protein [Mycobacterium sp. pUA109]|uniref:adenylate/guanylate cyclase domain-containing protein n=1 Tax=Mycobacterium sp. pUA109 TaxID=3238982 RepID=UPI00351B5564